MSFSISNQHKKYAVYAVCAALGLGLFWAIASARKSAKPPEVLNPISESFTGGVDTRSVSLDALARQVDELRASLSQNGRSVSDTMEGITATLSALTDQVAQMQGQAPLTGDPTGMSGRMAALEEALRGLQDERQTGGAVATGPVLPAAPAPRSEDGETEGAEATRPGRGVIAPPAAPAAPAPAQPTARERDQNPALLYQPAPSVPGQRQAEGRGGRGEADAAGQIRVYAAPEPDPAEKKAAEPKIPPLRIPPGSIITTFLLTGVDAPTGVQASGQPMPVLMRIKREAIMPNNAYADVVDCFLLGGAYGDLASERVIIRGETASCTLWDGSIFDGAAKFYAAGEDGKLGIHGNLVSRSGQAIANAAKAGFAQGITQAIGNSAIGDSASVGTVLSGGALGASSSAFDKIAEYYIDLAEQAHPVIEVANGRWVDVVLTETLEVSFEEETEGGRRDG
ncbi:MAG: hypothetical protein DI556_13425 [Rhodovulum sulfidophilum]|uniref:Conjugal transfer protein TraB n=1 Tax=Rhodovulum sulfidophilum TaxID=35806 RepID=A0A2W5QBN0_RHOSU|nr:MAG: hypothetical protein DI556_13425 [Rhodovulum sulfidophilum]